MRTLFVFIVLGLFFNGNMVSAATSAETDCLSLTHVLRFGDDSSDVRLLQQFLNQTLETRLSATGLGAPGAETTFFGSRTLRAVIKFQERYAQEVLVPAGLTQGTGYVGAFTLAKLHTLCAVAVEAKSTTTLLPVATTPTVTIVASATPTQTNVITVSTPLVALSSALAVDDTFLYVKYPDNYVVHPGDKVTIYGGGFTPTNNTLHIGTLRISELASSMGVLTTTLPLDAPKGKFDVWVENTRGVSEKTFIIISAPGTNPPVIDTFSPTTGQIGNTITVTGSGFTPTNNEIRMSVGTLEGIPAPDGKKLSFVLTTDIPGVTPELIPAGTTRNISLPVSFYVVNANGISNRAVFTVGY